MGAIVRAFDVRPEVAEQVKSMGADFVFVDMEQEVSKDGYAKEMTAEQVAATAAMYDAEARAADIVITTALIPGRPAPTLLTAETVAAMRPGSVIVDMAAANGGNVVGTVTGEKVSTANQVTIIGYTDLASRLAGQTSQLYGTNMVNLFKLLTPGKDGVVELNFDDVVQRGMTVAKDGELLWPPPAVQVSAAPAAAPAAVVAKEPPKPKDPRSALYKAALGALAFGVMAAYSPPQLLGHFTVFALAIFVGYYVISNVAHALHTPLMAETNAISGIILVGGILQIGSSNTLVTALALVAVLVASINIFGGFLVTLRMLEMFRKD
jgi:NAD(P) transhydrogenase subunit alpha